MCGAGAAQHDRASATGPKSLLMARLPSLAAVTFDSPLNGHHWERSGAVFIILIRDLLPPVDILKTLPYVIWTIQHGPILLQPLVPAASLCSLPPGPDLVSQCCIRPADGSQRGRPHTREAVLYIQTLSGDGHDIDFMKFGPTTLQPNGSIIGVAPSIISYALPLNLLPPSHLNQIQILLNKYNRKIYNLPQCIAREALYYPNSHGGLAFPSLTAIATASVASHALCFMLC